MARVDGGDCGLTVPNRFELVLLSAARAKQIATGSPLTVDRDNDKDSVVALREIADKTVGVNDLLEDVVMGFSKRRMEEPRASAGQADIEESFEDAAQHISSMKQDAANMAFGGEDVEAED